MTYISTTLVLNAQNEIQILIRLLTDMYSPMGFCPAVTASNVTTFPGSADALNAFGLTSVNLGLSSPLDLRANEKN